MAARCGGRSDAAAVGDGRALTLHLRRGGVITLYRRLLGGARSGGAPYGGVHGADGEHGGVAAAAEPQPDAGVSSADDGLTVSQPPAVSVAPPPPSIAVAADSTGGQTTVVAEDAAATAAGGVDDGAGGDGRAAADDASRGRHRGSGDRDDGAKLGARARVARAMEACAWRYRQYKFGGVHREVIFILWFWRGPSPRGSVVFSSRVRVGPTVAGAGADRHHEDLSSLHRV